MGLSILRDGVESIKNADFHSIMVDETSDVSNKEQAVFCVRWIDLNLFSYEDFLELHEMAKTDAMSRANLLRTYFFNCVLTAKNWGASAMTVVLQLWKKRRELL